MTWRMIHADCIEAMAGMDEASVDAIVTDPPYLIGFMGKRWDQGGAFVERSSNRRAGSFESEAGNHNPVDAADSVRTRRSENQKAQAWHEAWSLAALRVLKPGGHLLAFGGTRTYHRLACALEDAGFEIRDCLAWLYGSGFPKSLDVSKAIDKAAGAEREMRPNERWAERYPNGPGGNLSGDGRSLHYSQAKRITEPLLTSDPATPDAERWQGWGTALKPAFEPIVLARKPLGGTVAANVLEHGVGALNIDGTRIGTEGGITRHTASDGDYRDRWEGNTATGEVTDNGGRWPANVLLDEQAAEGLGPESRYYYTAKSGRAERNRGLEHRALIEDVGVRYTTMAGDGRPEPEVKPVNRANNHPTVKPVALMQWLCRLITPPKGTVLDPFTGSGTTGLAALREGFDFIGIEREADYVEIARDRIIGDAPLFNVETEA